MNQRLHKATDTIRELVLYYTLLLLTSASWFSIAEDVDFIPALYWAAITATSVGYGDISPKTHWGMLDAVFTSTVSLFIIVPLIVAKWIDFMSCKRDQFSHDEQEEIKSLLKQIKSNTEKE